MGLLGNILEKLGFGSAPAQAAPPIPASASPSPQARGCRQSHGGGGCRREARRSRGFS